MDQFVDVKIIANYNGCGHYKTDDSAKNIL